MDNLRDTFLKKLSFVIRMVAYFGAYNVPKDWWEVGIAKDESKKKLKKNEVHEAGTSFIIKRLDKMYKQEYDRALINCNVKVTETKQGIYYRNMDANPKRLYRFPGL